MQFSLSDALRELYSGEKYVITNSDYSTLDWKSDSPKPTLEELETKRDQMQADYDAKKYQRDRLYPEISDQLDMIYWDKKNGTKKWEEAIDKVKSDNPKPT
tara:strand:- start:29 stop:331 length:303 start_codon:yes stop_codon:yes gene_type:complete